MDVWFLTLHRKRTGTQYHVMVWFADNEVMRKAGYGEHHMFMTVLTPPPMITHADDWDGGMSVPSGLLRDAFHYIYNNLGKIHNGMTLEL